MKKELREKYINIRENINHKEAKNNLIYEKVINNKKVKEAPTILIYVSFRDEVDTLNLIKYFLKTKKVAVPKIENNTMNFYYITSIKDLAKGYFGILEPTTAKRIDNFTNAICITPGLCFNNLGYRLGYGKGFYDKFLAKHKIYAIGLCYKECLININFQEDNDYPVNEIISD